MFSLYTLAWGGGYLLALSDSRLSFDWSFTFKIVVSLLWYVTSIIAIYCGITGRRRSGSRLNEYDRHASIAGFTGRAKAGLDRTRHARVALLALGLCAAYFSLALALDGVGLRVGTREFEDAFGSAPFRNLFIFMLVPMSYFLLLRMTLEGWSKERMLGLVIVITPLIGWGVKGNVIIITLLGAIVWLDLKALSLKVVGVSALCLALTFSVMMSNRFYVGSSDRLSAQEISSKFLGYVSFNYHNLQAYTRFKHDAALGVGLLLSIPCLILTGSHWCVDDELLVDRSKPVDQYADPRFNIETGYGKLYLEFNDLTFLVLPSLLAALHSAVFLNRRRGLAQHGIYCYVTAASILMFFDMRLLHPVSILSYVLLYTVPKMWVRAR